MDTKNLLGSQYLVHWRVSPKLILHSEVPDEISNFGSTTWDSSGLLLLTFLANQ